MRRRSRYVLTRCTLPSRKHVPAADSGVERGVRPHRRGDDGGEGGGTPAASPPPVPVQTGAAAKSVTGTLAAGRRAAEAPVMVGERHSTRSWIPSTHGWPKRWARPAPGCAPRACPSLTAPPTPPSGSGHCRRRCAWMRQSRRMRRRAASGHRRPKAPSRSFPPLAEAARSKSTLPQPSAARTRPWFVLTPAPRGVRGRR